MYVDLVSKGLTLKEADAIKRQEEELLKKGIKIEQKRSVWNIIKFLIAPIPESELRDRIEVVAATSDSSSTTPSSPVP